MNKLNILYEDNHVIVVIKPSGILSQADNTNDEDMLTIIKKYIKEKYNKPGNVYLGLVHRLDRPVGGIMVFAKTSKAASRLSEQIRNNEFHKSYLALVHGYIEPLKGTMIDKIEKLDNQEVKLNTPNGKESILNYEVLKEKNDVSLVKIDLVTGRYHQIRVQFASRNHPLLGDYRHGIKDDHELCLYAFQLSFKHPISKEEMKFEHNPDSEEWTEFL